MLDIVCFVLVKLVLERKREGSEMHDEHKYICLKLQQVEKLQTRNVLFMDWPFM